MKAQRKKGTKEQRDKAICRRRFSALCLCHSVPCPSSCRLQPTRFTFFPPCGRDIPFHRRCHRHRCLAVPSCLPSKDQVANHHGRTTTRIRYSMRDAQAAKKPKIRNSKHENQAISNDQIQMTKTKGRWVPVLNIGALVFWNCFVLAIKALEFASRRKTRIVRYTGSHFDDVHVMGVRISHPSCVTTTVFSSPTEPSTGNTI